MGEEGGYLDVAPEEVDEPTPLPVAAVETDPFVAAVAALFDSADQTDGADRRGSVGTNDGADGRLDKIELRHRLNYTSLNKLLTEYGMMAILDKDGDGRVDVDERS